MKPDLRRTTGEQAARRELCEIGRRLYARQFAAGNDGNLSYRLSGQVILCTPTMISKGFMKPSDLCRVDLDGRLLSGRRQPTSEILMHLEIYRHDPSVGAVVHCHPPHATAFAVTRERIPSGILPEVEIFLGEVPRVEYRTPGTTDFAAAIRPYIGQANTVLLSNHGTVSWGPTLERAWWNAEILDAYCRILLLARQMGSPVRLSAGQVRELAALRSRFASPAAAANGRRPASIRHRSRR